MNYSKFVVTEYSFLRLNIQQQREEFSCGSGSRCSGRTRNLIRFFYDPDFSIVPGFFNTVFILYGNSEHIAHM